MSMNNSKHYTYLHSAAGTVDLTICEATFYILFIIGKSMMKNVETIIFLIILETYNLQPDIQTPCSIIKKTNWEKFRLSYQYQLIPGSNTNNEEDHSLYFSKTLLSSAKEIPKLPPPQN